MSHFFTRIIAVMGIAIIFFGMNALPARADAPEAPRPIETTFERARVVKIVDEIENEDYGKKIITQYVIAELLGGGQEGDMVPVSNDVSEDKKKQQGLQVGDQIIVGYTEAEGEREYFMSDVYRLPTLWIIIGFFFFITLLTTRGKGLRAFLGLIISFSIITFFIVPYILSGKNPLLISFVGTVAIACSSLYVAHGFRKRTTLAFIGTMSTILLALGISYLFVHLAKLFGIGSEEAFYLQAAAVEQINLQGLLLGGIIIGTLGVLDDITTAQVAAVEEIHLANRSLDGAELYRRGSSVGREHIISLVNTLILAYTGASLPLLLLFRIYPTPIWITMNSEIIMEEVVRMIAGSSALIIAVPITTAIAARYYAHAAREE